MLAILVQTRRDPSIYGNTYVYRLGDTFVSAWYDRYTRLWTAYKVTDSANLYQDASAAYGTTREDAVTDAFDMPRYRRSY